MTPAIALFLLACDPPGGQALPVERLLLPEVTVESAPLGQLTSTSFTVQNIGTAPAVFVLSATPPFRVSDQPITVEAGSTVEAELEYVAASYDEGSGVLTATTEHKIYSNQVYGVTDRDLDDDGFEPTALGGDDCDDTDPNLNPEVLETCDGIDQDCDGEVDEDAIDALPWFIDEDEDGFGSTDTADACSLPPGHSTNSDDCNDDRGDVYPGAPETWYDGVDADCAGDSDFDQDVDGVLALGFGGDDCDDTDATVFPGAADAWYDGIDGNCDGASDYDQDMDGFDSDAFGGSDCDDLDTSFAPTAPEIDDGEDQDCDGRVDEDFVLRGDVVITEVLVHPTTGAVGMQYIEMLNTSSRTVNLNKAELITRGGSLALGNILVGPNQTALFCGSTDPSDNGGLPCDWELPAELTDDDALVLNLERDIDEVVWEDWTHSSGVAWMLRESALGADANDEPSNWCEGFADPGTGDLGTPADWPNACP